MSSFSNYVYVCGGIFFPKSFNDKMYSNRLDKEDIII